MTRNSDCIVKMAHMINAPNRSKWHVVYLRQINATMNLLIGGVYLQYESSIFVVSFEQIYLNNTKWLFKIHGNIKQRKDIKDYLWIRQTVVLKAGSVWGSQNWGEKENVYMEVSRKSIIKFCKSFICFDG